jgi:hypothetical protein
MNYFGSGVFNRRCRHKRRWNANALTINVGLRLPTPSRGIVKGVRSRGLELVMQIPIASYRVLSANFVKDSPPRLVRAAVNGLRFGRDIALCLFRFHGGNGTIKHLVIIREPPLAVIQAAAEAPLLVEIDQRNW